MAFEYLRRDKSAMYTRRVYRFDDLMWNGDHDYVWKEKTWGDIMVMAHRIWEKERISRPFPTFTYSHKKIGSGCYARSNVILLCEYQLCPIVLIHELAHYLNPRGHTHGPSFIDTYLGLMMGHSGCDPAALMSAAMEAKLV